MRRILLSFATLCLGGCASQSILGESGEMERDHAGFVVATFVHTTDIAQPDLVAAGIDAGFFAQPNAATPAFSLTTAYRMSPVGLLNRWQARLTQPNGWRVMVLLRVPAGRYRMGRLAALYPASRLQTVAVVADAPVIAVREGEVTYVGSIQLQTSASIGAEGRAWPAQARFAVLDESATDIPALKRADERLEGLPFINALAERRAMGAITQVLPHAAPVAPTLALDP